MPSKTYTVGELIKELQRAVIVDELDWESEILGYDLHPISMDISKTREVDGLKIPGHVVIV